MMKNIRISVEYDGTPYSGWQRQNRKGCVTVQGEIEAALQKILQENISLAAAGRTDKGVHAKAQIANFVTDSSMDLSRMVHSLNALLPNTIRITNPLEMPADFHARHSARERHYRYFLVEEPSAIYGRFSGCSNGTPDLALMQQSAGLVVGVHDFSAFSREHRDSQGKLCRVTACEWYRCKRFLVMRISANRFLRSMVRYLVDGMLRVGKGSLSVEEFSRMLNTGVMTSQLTPASPAGLFLWKVTY
jgi:tRNA pseudouridine38-40 synthase